MEVRGHSHKWSIGVNDDSSEKKTTKKRTGASWFFILGNRLSCLSEEPKHTKVDIQSTQFESNEQVSQVHFDEWVLGGIVYKKNSNKQTIEHTSSLMGSPKR